ncbi:MAG: DinB family protein [Planctomycetia bacterium]|nr:DinB family protein [Planctomycetia bacterium]
MDVKDSILSTRGMSSMVLTKYLSDLEDADLMLRPTPGCNHLAWQLGHLISSDAQLIDGACPGKSFELPAGFAEAHAKDKCGCDDAAKFRTKQEYLDLIAKADAALTKALQEMPVEQFDAPSPEWMRSFFPTVGHMFTLIATHAMMHAGQFAVVRRQLGKPILI